MLISRFAAQLSTHKRLSGGSPLAQRACRALPGCALRYV